MANYSSLKSAVTSVIKTNGNKEITGAVLQSTLLAIINSLGDGFLFKGVATPSTNPGTPDQNVFYIGGAGTYTNFNSLEVPTGYLGVLKYNGVWAVSTIQVGAVPVNDLTTGGTTVPLSAEMGKTLKTYHDNNATAIQTVDGKVSQLEAKLNTLASTRYYGIFASSSLLPADASEKGYAYVGATAPLSIYEVDYNSETEQWEWTDTEVKINSVQGEPGTDGVGFSTIGTPVVVDGTVIITLSNGDTITLDLNHDHLAYPKYHLCTDEAEYTAITTKDSTTLYLIPES